MRKILIVFSILMSCESQRDEISHNIFENFADEKQTFLINNKRDTTIIGIRGTEITIPENSFDESINEVRMNLYEYYSKANMIKKGLITLSVQKDQLISGGMIFIEAYSDDSIIYPAQNSKIYLRFNSNYGANKFDMDVYRGINKNNHTTELYWLRTENGHDFKRKSTVVLSNGESKTVYSTEIDKSLVLINNLGWYNYDVTFEADSMCNIMVSTNRVGVVLRLAYINQNTILPGISNERGEFIFENVPKNEQVVILAFDQEDSDILFASRYLESSKNDTVNLVLKKSTYEEIEERINFLQN